MQKNEDVSAAEKLSKALLQFRFLYHYSKRNYVGNQKKFCSLRPGDMIMLFTIWNEQQRHNGSVTATELSASMGIKPPSIIPVLSVLEKQGLILRATDLSDRRYVRITLSEAGTEQVKRCREHFETRMHGLVAYLGIEKSNQLADLMGEVYGYLQQKRRQQTNYK